MTQRGPPLVVRADRDGMSRLLAWIDERFEALDLPVSAQFAARLCLEEVVQNVVSHGVAPSCRSIVVKVWLERESEGVTAVVEDDGAPFDALSGPLPARPSSLADAKVGGQGLLLIRRFTKSALYTRSAELNRLTLGFDAGSREHS